MAKGLAFLVLISCSVSAFCLAMLAYTYMTGEFPFHIQPIMRTENVIPETRSAKTQTIPPPGTRQRLDEQFVQEFYSQLMVQREKTAADQERISRQEKELTALRESLENIRTELLEREDKLMKLVEKIKAEDVQHLTKLSNLVAGMDVAQASTLTMAFDDRMASRILYLMNQKKASQIIQQVVQSGKKEDIDRIRKISDDMSKLSKEKNP
jgi:flagellar motility protein MotE (MotC chaperone)